MKTMNKVVASPSSVDSLNNYLGKTEFDGWLCLLTQNRDSDCLTRSNFRSALEKLGGESENVQIFNFGHWACGWWEALAVRSGSDVEPIANDIEAALEDYPVVDEEDFSNLETEEANEIWKDCYDKNDRIEYIRKHRRQFDFRDFRDMLSCVRGQYFAGYANELIE
jgi:hypothetical protein